MRDQVEGDLEREVATVHAGASLAVWQPGTWPGAGRINDVGCMGWNELQTRESGATGDFYGGPFGWEIEPIEDDGKLVYTTIKNADNQNGGFMPMTEQHGDAPSFWLPYFSVPRATVPSSRQGSWAVAFWLDRWTSLLARSPSLPIPRAPRSPSSRARPRSRGSSPCSEAYRQQ